MRNRVLVLVCFGPTSAAASHSPAMPVAERVLTRANDATAVVVETRFGGLYVTTDAGRTFFNVCHDALGADDTETYPGVIVADGTVAVSTGFRGVSTSREGCDWGQWTPDGVGLVSDLASFGARGLLALKTESTEPSSAEIWASNDAGTTWVLAGSPLPLDVAATSVGSSADGSQWFVGGQSATGATLLRSMDGGNTWTKRALPPGWNSVTRIVGVTPPPLERLVVVLTGDGGDAVIDSDDGGATWATLYASPHAIPGTALDEEGLLYFGGPDVGVYRLSLADVGDSQPLQVSMTKTRGLSAAAGKVYSIGDERTDGYSVAVSIDQGATFSPFFSVCKTDIVRPCNDASSVGSTCSAGIETEPWKPLGGACGAATPMPAPAESVAQPMSAPAPSMSGPASHSNRASCAVTPRAGSDSRGALAVLVAAGACFGIRRRIF